RDFTEQDNEQSPAVVIVNEAMAHRQWPDENPVGKRIALGDDQKTLSIVGVAKNARQSDWTSEPGDEMYLPYLQRPSAFGLKSLTFVARTAIAPDALAGAVRGELAKIDNRLPVSHLMSMEQVISDKLWRARLATGLLGAFGMVALAMAA